MAQREREKAKNLRALDMIDKDGIALNSIPTSDAVERAAFKTDLNKDRATAVIEFKQCSWPIFESPSTNVYNRELRRRRSRASWDMPST